MQNSDFEVGMVGKIASQYAKQERQVQGIITNFAKLDKWRRCDHGRSISDAMMKM